MLVMVGTKLRPLLIYQYLGAIKLTSQISQKTTTSNHQQLTRLCWTLRLSSQQHGLRTRSPLGRFRGQRHLSGPWWCWWCWWCDGSIWKHLEAVVTVVLFRVLEVQIRFHQMDMSKWMGSHLRGDASWQRSTAGAWWNMVKHGETWWNSRTSLVSPDVTKTRRIHWFQLLLTSKMPQICRICQFWPRLWQIPHWSKGLDLQHGHAPWYGGAPLSSTRQAWKSMEIYGNLDFFWCWPWLTIEEWDPMNPHFLIIPNLFCGI